MIRNIVNCYLKFKSTINSLLHAMKVEKKLGRFKYIFLRLRIGPLFHRFTMNLSGKTFNSSTINTHSGHELSSLFVSYVEVMDCQNFKAKKKSSNFLRSAKFEKFRNTFSIFWRNLSKGYFPWQDSITWHRF